MDKYFWYKTHSIVQLTYTFSPAFLCSLKGPVKMIHKSYLSDPTEMQERQQQSSRTQEHHKLCSLSCSVSLMLSHQMLACHCRHVRPSVDSLQWQSCQHHTLEDGRRQSCPASTAGCHCFFWGSGAASHHHTHPLTSTPGASVSIPSTVVCCAHMQSLIIFLLQVLLTCFLGLPGRSPWGAFTKHRVGSLASACS